eukprot:CAMPEP_0170073746 /NCGR_PEP_ID=MMETSP0019_2-20121128/11136_1 /TAXON_ID=98059 /ORGANISM="Dinobryon sp., Strain UTEXLB2267" /LENGTH=190 /DNA_ID=CAMNT_0010283529 /DNA_START=110 /DNA_END=682 /DNA_ORIENTATION=-
MMGFKHFSNVQKSTIAKFKAQHRQHHYRLNSPFRIYASSEYISSSFLKIFSSISKKLDVIFHKPVVLVVGGLALSIVYLLFKNLRSKSNSESDSKLTNSLEKSGGSSVVKQSDVIVVPEELTEVVSPEVVLPPPTITVPEVIPKTDTPLAIFETPAPVIETPPPQLFSIPKRWNKKSDKWSPGNLIRPLP